MEKRYYLFFLSYNGAYDLDRTYIKWNIPLAKNNEYENEIGDSASAINGDEVYCWTSRPRWNLYAGKQPYSRYCGWHITKMNSNISVRVGLEKMFAEKPPMNLVIDKPQDDTPEFVFESIRDFYTEVSENNSFILYRRRQ